MAGSHRPWGVFFLLFQVASGGARYLLREVLLFLAFFPMAAP